MKKMLDSYGIRFLAFLLCLAFAIGAVVCAGCFLYNYYEPDNTGGGSEGFVQNGLAWSYVSQDMWRTLDMYVYTLHDADGPYLNTPSEGISYVIYDPDGNIAADTRTENARAVGSDGVYWSAEGYTARAYLELPARQGSPLDFCVRLYDFLYNNKNVVLPVGAALAGLALLLFVFLMAAAGRTPEGVRLGGLHRWPLEIYNGALLIAAVFLIWVMAEVGNAASVRQILMVLTVYGVCGLGIGAVCLLACMDLAARFRAGKWWRGTVTFFCLKWCWRITKWCLRWCGRILRSLCHGLGSLGRSLPLTWKTALGYCVFTILNVVLAVSSVWEGEGWMVLLVFFDLAGLAAVIWVAMQLKKLQAAGRALAAGDLSVSVETKRMLPVFREHAENLGAVSLGMTRAVNERMKSERFKTELITNVSHDLKTPLTNIVSYIDLLKKEPIENPRAEEYIEVLDRQSQRLKKLTTDLVEASKASSGVITPARESVDLGELVQQSAGEYAERFAAAQLTPVLDLPEGGTVITADGRLLWRVLDNLLNNVVKYALPGTRVYLDLTTREGRAVLSVKNISRERLNIPADELMGRFVRGDVSRSSDGSGLGLSIARSLTELMGGELRLTLDGDLFKAELIF